MTGADNRDEGTATAGEDEPAVGAMHFTVLDRRGDRVHLVSVEADTDTLYGHPSVCEQVWQEALADVPQNWDVVDLCPAALGPERPRVTATDDKRGPDLDEYAARRYDLFLAFLEAGFDRCEALTLVIETMHAGDGD